MTDPYAEIRRSLEWIDRNSSQGGGACGEIAEIIDKLEADNQRIVLWIATDIARARGLAEAIQQTCTNAHPLDITPDAIAATAEQIVRLLTPKDDK